MAREAVRCTMHASKRTVIIRSFWAVIFLLIALAPYIAVKLGSQDAAFFSAFVTPLFLAVSEIAGVSAIMAGSHVTKTRKRRVLVWSLIFVASALAGLMILLGSFLVSATPYCTDPLTARVCAQNLGLPAYFSMGAFAALSILAVFVAPILALSDAARTGKWLWFLVILVFLLGSLAASVLAIAPLGRNALTVFTSRDWVSMLRIASPLLLPFIALLYILTGRERSNGSGKRDSDEREEQLVFTLRSPHS
jgi:hypothetical protein